MSSDSQMSGKVAATEMVQPNEVYLTVKLASSTIVIVSVSFFEGAVHEFDIITIEFAVIQLDRHFDWLNNIAGMFSR